MFIQVLLFCGLCYLIWKKTEKIKIRNSVRPYHLYHLPILQFIACLLFCAFSFIIIGNNASLTEINSSINNEWFGDDISSIISDSGFTPDEISYYLMVENLKDKAVYILICSIIMTFLQTYLVHFRKLNNIAIECIAAIHTFCIFYIANLSGETFMFMIKQMSTMQLLNIITNDNSSSSLGLIAIWLIPFHYMYHFILQNHYKKI